MTDLDLLLAIAGAVVTILVVAGMVLITPRGQVQETPAAGSSARADASSAPRFDRSHRLPDPVRAPVDEPETRLDGVPTDLRPA